MKVVTGEAKCAVQCPHCSNKSTLSTFWTKTGPSFRVANFKRHFETHKKTRVDQKLTLLKKYNHMMTLRNIVLSKKNMLLRSELQCAKKCTPMTPLENLISEKKSNVESSSGMNMNSKLVDENNGLQIRLNASLCEIHRLNDERKNLLNMNLDLRGRIRVFCRLRPTLMSEVGMETIEYHV